MDWCNVLYGIGGEVDEMNDVVGSGIEVEVG